MQLNWYDLIGLIGLVNAFCLLVSMQHCGLLCLGMYCSLNIFNCVIEFVTTH